MINLNIIRKVFSKDKYHITGGATNKTIILQHINNKKIILICSDNFYNTLSTSPKNIRKNCKIYFRTSVCIYLPQYVVINKYRSKIINSLLND